MQIKITNIEPDYLAQKCAISLSDDTSNQAVKISVPLSQAAVMIFVAVHCPFGIIESVKDIVSNVGLYLALNSEAFSTGHIQQIVKNFTQMFGLYPGWKNVSGEVRAQYGSGWDHIQAADGKKWGTPAYSVQMRRDISTFNGYSLPNGLYVYAPTATINQTDTSDAIVAVSDPVVLPSVATIPNLPSLDTAKFERFKCEQNFDSEDGVWVRKMNVETNIVGDELVELIQDRAEEFFDSDTDELDELIINGINVESNGEFDILTHFPNPAPAPAVVAQSPVTEETLGDLKVEADGRIRIPTSVLKKMGSPSKLRVVEQKGSKGRVFTLDVN